MGNPKITVMCPKCDESFVLDDALMQSFEDKLSGELKKKYQPEIRKLEEKLEAKEKEGKNLEKQLQKKIRDQLEEEFEEEKKSIAFKAAEAAEKSVRVKIKDQENQIKEKDEQLKKLEEVELKFLKEKRELEDAKRKFNLDKEKIINEEKDKIFKEATTKVSEEFDLKIKERDTQIEKLKSNINDLNRSADSRSQQLQGEVFEEKIEDTLRENFNLDDIQPVSSGVNGADITQRVVTPKGKVCGLILIETKNAKKWSNNWVKKLKEDMLAAKADMGVIVTTTLPDSVNNFEVIAGIAVVEPRFAIQVLSMLRQQVIEVSQVKSLNVGKNEKIEALSQYIMSAEFRQRMISVMSAFIDMKTELDQEKRAMTRLWAKREKQIQNAITGLASTYGSFQGIIGPSMPKIEQLEFEEEKTDETE